jgi:Bacteriocin-protection, YdeI or OmpD-Associated/Domain of unknown function (DUF1905)
MNMYFSAGDMGQLKAICILRKFGDMGEKTGWNYLLFSPEQIQQLRPGMRKSFRVKGKLNALEVDQLALIPMGDGSFILSLNADLRRKLGVRTGYEIKVVLEPDNRIQEVTADLLDCLADVPEALAYFNSLPLSHRMYFSKWIDSAKTEATRTKRIAMTVDAAAKKWGYPEMIRAGKKTD